MSIKTFCFALAFLGTLGAAACEKENPIEDAAEDVKDAAEDVVDKAN